jgi:chromosome segregation ATPase
VQKTIIIAFAVGLLLGAAGTGFVACYRTGGNFDWFTGEYRASQQRAAEEIAGLERTIGEQRKRIDDLEAGNSRLEGHIRDARGLCEQALGGSEKAAGNIRDAISLSKALTGALTDINRVLNRDRSSGDSGDGMDNMEDL